MEPDPKKDLKEKLRPQAESEEYLPSSKDMKIKNDYLGKERYLTGSSIFSTLFFTWISPLLTFGNKFQVDEKAIPILSTKNKPKIEYDLLEQTFQNMPKGSR